MIPNKLSIELDLNEILTDENGYPEESVEQSIKRQVIEKIAETAKKGIGRQIEISIRDAVAKVIDSAVAEKLPSMIDMLLNEEYTPRTQWGEKLEPTTVRNELIKRFREEFQYVKTDPYGNRSKATAFSQAVDKFVEEKLREFKKTFDDTVGKQFHEEALKYVGQVISKKFNVN